MSNYAIVNTKNVAPSIQELSENNIQPQKDNKIYELKGKIVNDDFTLAGVKNLYNTYIKKGIAIWNVNGILDTPSNNNKSGSLYMNYDNKSYNFIDYAGNASNEYVNMVDKRPTYCGKMVKSYSTIISAVYDNFYYCLEYVSPNNYLLSKSDENMNVLWSKLIECGRLLTSRYPNCKLYATDKFLILIICTGETITSPNSLDNAITILNPDNGNVYNSSKIENVSFGTSIAFNLHQYEANNIKYNDINIWLKYSKNNGDVERVIKYTIKDNSPTSMSTYFGAEVNVNGSSIRYASFDADGYCISYPEFLYSGSSSQFICTNVYYNNYVNPTLYFNQTIDIYSKLKFATENQVEICEILFKIESTPSIGFYYRNQFDYQHMYSSTCELSSNGIGNTLLESDISYLGTFKNIGITFSSHHDSVGNRIGYCVSSSFLIRFTTSSSNMSVVSTERLNSENFGRIPPSSIIVDPKTNIIRSYNGDVVFRDNGLYKTRSYYKVITT